MHFSCLACFFASRSTVSYAVVSVVRSLQYDPQCVASLHTWWAARLAVST